MDIEEEISERIIRQAFEGGGEVIFTDTELKECTDRKLLQKVNLQLSLYGAINDITTANDTIIQGIMCSNDSAIKPLTITEKPPGMAWVVILSLTIRMII